MLQKQRIQTKYLKNNVSEEIKAEYFLICIYKGENIYGTNIYR